jgi:hypothetical protein
METIKPNPIQVAFVYGTSGSVYATWDTDTEYYTGARVYDDVASQDYEAKEPTTTFTPRPSESKKWKEIGSSAYAVSTYETDADISEYDTFVPDTDIPSQSRWFDPTDGNDWVWTGSTVPSTNDIADFFPSQGIYSDWVKIGGANGLRLVNTRVIERTRFDSSLTTTLWATGAANRLGLFGLVNVKTADVAIEPGEKFPNSSFVSPTLGGWEATGALSHSSGAITFDDEIGYLLPHVPGFAYSFEAEFTLDDDEYAKVQVQTADGATVLAESDAAGGTIIDFSSGNLDDVSKDRTASVAYTATGAAHRLALLPTGAYTVQADSVSCRQTGVSPEHHVLDLAYAEADNSYKPAAKIVLTETMDSPAIDLVLETEYSKQQGEIGLVCAGTAQLSGKTKVDVRRRIQDYSYIDFNEDFGTGEFLQRGYQDEVEVELLVPDTQGAFLDWFFRRLRAIPCMVDLSTQKAGGSQEVADDGLLAFGLIVEPERRTSALPGTDRISLTILGLVTETEVVET